MKKMVLLTLCLLSGIFILTGCSSDAAPFMKKDYTVDGKQVTGICIDVRDRKIEVSLSADDQIHMEYFENNKEYYDISVSDDKVLAMNAKNNKDWTDYIGGKISADFRIISLQIPETLLSVLNLSTTNGDILLPPITVADEVVLSSNSGNIIFDKLAAGRTISVSNKNGDISGSIAGSYEDFNISCDIKKGRSNLPDRKNSGEKTLDILNNNGDIGIKFIGNRN